MTVLLGSLCVALPVDARDVVSQNGGFAVIPVVSAPPLIDGRPAERVWSRATPARGFRLVGSSRPAAENTEVRLLTDREYLYVAIVCREAFTDRILSERRPSPAEFWSSDHVSVEFASMSDPRQLAAFAVNPAGAAVSTGLADDQWLRASITGDFGWSTEIAIPLAAIGGRPGSLSRRVGATRYHARTGETSQWVLGTPRLGTEGRGADIGSPDRSSLGRFEATVSQQTVVASDYVWRGFVVERPTVVQPTFTLVAGNVTVSSWSNVTARPSRLTEHDLTVDYTATRGSYVFSAGWINYAFPQMSVDTTSNEFYVGVGRTGLLNPTAHFYQDVQAGSGRYVHLGVSETIELAERVQVTPSFGIGYNDRLFISESTFSDAVVGLSLSVPTPIASLSVEPFMAYSRSLNHRLFNDRLYGGVGVMFGDFSVR